ncbi:hypothetical protein PM082_006540 [Marasmius tenuissimus]|nr:hypothetical protein PM082_006540 [Marasmius tenuissimus]
MSSFSLAKHEAQMAIPSTSLDEDERELARQEDILEKLQRQIKKQENKRDQVLGRVVKRRRAAASLRKIPVEVWEEIFTFVCLTEDTSSFYCYIDAGIPDAKHEIDYSPCVVSSVCSYWRAVALSYPRLWSFIEVHLHNLQWDIRRPLDLFIKNAQNHPLSVFISCSPDQKGHTDTSRSALELLAKHLGRCETISLYIRGNFSVIDFPQPPTQSFPLLKAFYTDLTSARNLIDVQTSGWFWEAIRVAPLLDHLDMDQFPIVSGAFPYRQVTHLTLRKPPNTSPPSLKDLPLCRNLRTLTLFHYCRVKQAENPRMRFVHREPPNDVEIPSLRRLVIQNGHTTFPTYLISLFTWFILPSLEELKIELEDPIFPPVSQFPTSFLPTFTRSTDSLRKLTLQFSGFPEAADPSALFDVLKGTPNLIHLELFTQAKNGIIRASPVTRLFNALTIQPNSSPESYLLPKLEVLRIHDPEFLSVDPQVLTLMLSMLQSRFRPVGAEGTRTRLTIPKNAPRATPLSKFSLTFCHASYCACGPEPDQGLYGKIDFIKKARTMESKGVRVSVKHIERDSTNLLEVQPKLDGLDWNKLVEEMMAKTA